MVLDEHAPTAAKIDVGIRLGMPSFIILLTALRLYIRGPRRWQWDDFLVCVGVFFTIVDTPVSLILSLRYGHMDPKQLALNYASYLFFLCSLWCCRLSILMSIAQITPGTKERRRRELISIPFVLLWCLEMAQVGWTCGKHGDWNRITANPDCFSKNRMPITHLITSVLSDFLLIFLPLRTLSGLKANFPRIRIRLSLAFLASICTTAFSMAISLTLLTLKAFDPHYLGSFEGYTSLIVCSIPILTVAVCRVFKIRDCDRSDNISLPPIKFAPRPRNADRPADVTGVTTEDISRSARSWNSFANGVKSFTPSESGARPSVGIRESKDYATRSFLGRLRTLPVGFNADEEECDAEVRTMDEEEHFHQDVEKVVQGLDDDSTRESRGKAILNLRRHSMTI